MNIEKLTKKIGTLLESGTDEEVLLIFSKFLNRVSMSSEFIQDEEGLFTHEMMLIACGDRMIASEATELEWPLQMLPLPEAFQGKVN